MTNLINTAIASFAGIMLATTVAASAHAAEPVHTEEAAATVYMINDLTAQTSSRLAARIDAAITARVAAETETLVAWPGEANAAETIVAAATVATSHDLAAAMDAQIAGLIKNGPAARPVLVAYKN